MSVSIERPVEDVFDYYLAPENHLEWQDDLLEASPLSEGPVDVGSRFRLRRRLGGRVHEGVWEITALERTKRVEIAATTEQGMIDHSSVARFEPAGGATRLTLDVEPRPRGARRLLLPVIRRAIRRALPTDLERLKATLEQAPPPAHDTTREEGEGDEARSDTGAEDPRDPR